MPAPAAGPRRRLIGRALAVHAVLDESVLRRAAVYLENKTRVFYLDSEAEVQRYERAFDLLSGMALDPAESRALIRSAAAEP